MIALGPGKLVRSHGSAKTRRWQRTRLCRPCLWTPPIRVSVLRVNSDNDRVSGRLGTQSPPKSEPPSGRLPDPDPDENDSDDELELSEEELTAAAALDSLLRAGLCTLLCSLLGQLLDIDFASAFKLTDGTQDALLGLQASIVLALLTSAVLLVQPESVVKQKTTDPSQAVLAALDRADRRLENVLQVSVNLNPFQQGSAGAGGLRAKAMTETPFASGLRLFQMWFTKPYSPTSWSLDKAAVILPSTCVFLAANELLLRGVFATLFSRWAQEAVTKADSSSFLVWAKVFGYATDDTFRWLGTMVVGLLSVAATTPSAERAQKWARAVLREDLLEVGGRDAVRSDQEQASGSESSSSQVAEGGVSVNGAMYRSDARSNSLSNSASGRYNGANEKEMATDNAQISGVEPKGGADSTKAKDELGPNHAIAYDASTGEVGLMDIVVVSEDENPTQEDEVVYNFAAAYGIAQVLQVTLLYGLTGNLVAPLVARVGMDIFGIAAAAKSEEAAASNAS